MIAERFHFHTRNQNEGEGVADYAAALKKYTERCKFDSFLGQALRDRFVHGLKNRAIQKKLLTEKDLTWKLAVDIAHAMESADKQANTLRSEGNSSTQEIRSNDRDPVRYVDNEKESTDFGGLFHVHESNPKPSIVIPVQINGTKVSMELDLQCQLCQSRHGKKSSPNTSFNLPTCNSRLTAEKT